ncbi:hypothetical protein FZEAL_1258 [Fusarium zealandicum]|uniref:TECPR1-like DysF domain-containing protein n=1 Tax=Fusarium zealandicum TaxID=1053134 RepID=A0A8H4UT63_9HYPO|nr:hypothetical protein FZEAL_1258 [Fusarium zealandicum]
MDDFTTEILASGRAFDSPESPERRRDYDEHHESPLPGSEATSSAPPRPPTPTQKTGLRGGFAAIRHKASLQDRLVEKLLQQVIPTDNNDNAEVSFAADEHTPAQAEKPNFNITTMSYNFRRFNARIGVVFKFQGRVLRILSWHHASHTLSLLAVYTFVCLDPYLICVLPLAILLLGVFIPAFLARHPAPPKGTLSSEQNVGYSPAGPPLAPAATVKPVKELSKDFFRNMRDLQNCMDDFSVAHDKVVTMLVPVTNFSDEALSSALFLFVFTGGIFMTIAAQLLPWRFIFLLGGWAIVGMGHPYVARLLAVAHRERLQPQEAKARSWLDNWIAKDVILDSSPETREVEIFELQRKTSGGGEWEPWLFCPSPYDPLSQPRIVGERPRGSRFFEDIMPPEAWEWSEKKWALDLWSREWVEERIITGVEVETEGERWVYDIYDDREFTGVIDPPVSEKGKQKAAAKPSWEEGEDGSGRRGDWRRRRWVRLVKRRAASAQAT